MTLPTIVLSTGPAIRPALHFDHYRLVAFPIVLRREREARGLSPAMLAAAAGLGREDIVDLEAGTAVPALDVLFALADVLGTDAADLLHETRRTAEDLVVDSWCARRPPRARTAHRCP